MTFDLIWLLAGFVGIGGAVYIALLFLAPAIALVVEKLLLNFISSRVGLAIVVGGACLFGGDLYRHHLDAKVCAQRLESLNKAWQKEFDNAAQKFEEARKQRDAEIDQQLKEANQKREQDLADSEKDWQARFQEYQKSIKPGDSCVITPEDVQK